MFMCYKKWAYLKNVYYKLLYKPWLDKSHEHNSIRSLGRNGMLQEEPQKETDNLVGGFCQREFGEGTAYKMWLELREQNQQGTGSTQGLERGGSC